MRWFVPVAAILLAGCNGLFGPTEAEKAISEYEMVAKTALEPRDKCAAARKVEAAYLREGNDQQYRYWNSIAAGMCL
jgi:hypothetical protein